MRCDLIIPALNEASNMDGLFDALAALPDDLIRHVVVADNGSTDGTDRAAEARGAVVVHEPQRGYGAACLKAIEWIDGRDTPPDTVAFLDADLADDPGVLPALLEPIEKDRAQIVIGSRVRRAEPGALTMPQRCGNALSCLLIRVLTGHRFSDLGPLRAVRWTTFKDLEMTDLPE